MTRALRRLFPAEDPEGNPEAQDQPERDHQELGCDLAQGFFLSRPLPAGEAERVLAEGLSQKLAVPA